MFIWIKIKGKSILSIVLIFSMMFTMFSNVVFADVGIKISDCTDDCVVKFEAAAGLSASNLKITQTTIQEINAGMTFDDVFVDKPKIADSDPSPVNYYEYYNTVQGTYKTIDRSTTVSSVFWAAQVDSRDETTQKVTAVTIFVGIEWNTNWAYFNPRTGASDDDGTWPDTGGSEQRFFSSGDYHNAKMPKPVRKGYTFKNWYYLDDNNSPVNVEAIYNTFNQKTYYPVWEVAQYAIDYELDGGVNSASNPDKYSYGTGVASFEEPTREYYKFDGWYSDSSFSTPITSISATSTGDIKLYAKWTATHFALNFDSNGGVDGSVISVMVPKGDKISDYLTTLPGETPTKEGYTFKGWLRADGSELTDSDVMTEKGYTVYADWEAGKYKLSFDLKGGEGTIDDVDINYGDKISDKLTATVPTKTGYTFKGWVKSDGSELTDSDTVTGDFTVYANWEINKYKLSFDLKGGEGSIADVDVTYGEKISDNLTATIPTKTGYNFKGWVKADGSELTDSDVMTESGYTVYANWDVEKYKLSFDLKGGEGTIDDVDVDYGDKISDKLTATVPTKAGHTFKGWVKADGSELTDSDVVTGNVTVYANWEANKYKLSFDVNGGKESIADVDVSYGEKISDNLTTTVPTKVGYNFKSWVKADGSELTESDVMTESGYTVYASWSIEAYKLSFDLNGGEGSIADVDVDYGDKISDKLTATIPTKTGHTFKGWVKADGSAIADSDIVTGNVTVYANWEANKYKLSFDLKGGEGSFTDVDINYGEKISDNLTTEVPTKAGYTFKGWVKADGSELTDSDVMTENGYTVYASWGTNKYKLSFDVNGGEGSITDVDVDYGEKISDNLTTEVPTRTGYNFKGWVKADGSELTDSDVVTGNVTVYASWEANKYKLSFDVNGGEGSIADVDVNYGEKISDNLTTTAPTKTGYTFKGWVKADGSGLTDGDVMTENGYTVYANWEANKYKLSFDVNGGEGSIADVEVNYGDKISDNLTKTVPTKAGYNFKGWVKADGSALTDSDVMTESGYTVYASWGVEKYKLSFDVNGGEGSIADVDVDYGEKISDKLTTTVPTKTGYIFKGWVKADGSELTDSDVVTGNVTVYASWEANKYKLSFDVNGGEGNIADVDVDYGEKVSDKLTTTVPTRTGYTFNGWVKADGSGLTDSDVMTENGYTVYANWEANKYKLSFDVNGGEGSIADVDVNYGEKISANLTATAPTRTGYTFNGWVKADGSALTDSDVMTESGYTVFASWKANDISVKEQVISGRINEAVGDNVSLNVDISNGTGSYTFELDKNQTLPKGISIDSEGVVSGTYLEVGKFSVNVIVTDSNSKASVVKTVRFEIAKAAAPEVVFPVINGSLTYGSKLSEIALSGKGEGTFEWVEPDTIPNVENSGYAVRFVPTESSLNEYDYGDDFQFVRNVSVSVTPVSPTLVEIPKAANISRNVALKNSKIYGGKFVGIDGQVIEGTYEWKEPDTTFKDYGTYEKAVVFTPENSNYAAIEFNVNVTVRSSGGSSSSTPITYTINASCSEGGSISPEGKLEVYEYSNTTYKFAPYSGYRIAEVKVDGEVINNDSINGEYTFRSVQGYHKIYVKFEEGDAVDAKKVRDNNDEETEETSAESKKDKEQKEENSVSDEAIENVNKVFNTSNDANYINGYPDNSFKPSKPLTRAEASTVISRLLKEQPENANYDSKFSDVANSEWYSECINYLVEKGILNGYSDGTFKPNANITRAEMVAIVVKALGLSGEFTNVFSDTKGSWAENYIAIANAYGWINGYSDGTFRPNANITRAEATAFLNRVVGRKASSNSSDSGFSDVNSSDWFFEDVIAATGK